MNEETFRQSLSKINILVTDEQLKQLHKYYNLIIEYNCVMNLTGITLESEVYLKHFYDSATLNMIVDLSKEKTLCDVGSGAGLPGIVLKILFPNLHITLVDSLQKRINFLNIVIKELDLHDISTVHARIEEYGIINREKFDIVTARAVTNLPTLLEYCVPLAKVGKYVIPMKANIKEELLLSASAIKILDIKLVSEKLFQLPIEKSNRCLLKFKKLFKTNKKYPRKFSEIKKQSL